LKNFWDKKEIHKEYIMSLQPKTLVTPEKYLALERKADHKSEYYAGEIFAMAGASERHNLIVANVIAELRAGLKRRDCKVYARDMRIKVSSTGLYTYPDVMVVCGKPQLEDDH
jgi:Uma2 family endonuclease